MIEKQQPAEQKLLQIVPRFPPALDGLGEFALHLGHALYARQQLASEYIIWRPAENTPTPARIGPHTLHTLAAPTANELARELSSLAEKHPGATLLLHYTSYSYSNEGLPVWLPGILREYKSKGGRLVTYFHELYAKGRFPNKTWFGSWLQKRIFRQILALSDAAITSNLAYLDEMRRYARPAIPLLLSGVGSNVGELNAPPREENRKRKVVVFGLAATRARLYLQHLPRLKQLAELLDIDEIADLGSTSGIDATIDSARTALGPIFKNYGVLQAAQISEILATSIAGAVNYRYDLRLKSGVVAAYQAHALPTILFTPSDQQLPSKTAEDALTAEQVLTVQKEKAEELLKSSAISGFALYQSHRSFAKIASDLLPLL